MLVLGVWCFGAVIVTAWDYFAFRKSGSSLGVRQLVFFKFAFLVLRMKKLVLVFGSLDFCFWLLPEPRKGQTCENGYLIYCFK
jgi:hypothetical protein